MFDDMWWPPKLPHRLSQPWRVATNGLIFLPTVSFQQHVNGLQLKASYFRCSVVFYGSYQQRLQTRGLLPNRSHRVHLLAKTSKHQPFRAHIRDEKPMYTRLCLVQGIIRAQ